MKNARLKNTIAKMASLGLFASSTLMASDLPSTNNANPIKQDHLGQAMQAAVDSEGYESQNQYYKPNQSQYYEPYYQYDEYDQSQYYDQPTKHKAPPKDTIRQHLLGPAMRGATESERYERQRRHSQRKQDKHADLAKHKTSTDHDVKQQSQKKQDKHADLAKHKTSTDHDVKQQSQPSQDEYYDPAKYGASTMLNGQPSQDEYYDPAKYEASTRYDVEQHHLISQQSQDEYYDPAKYEASTYDSKEKESASVSSKKESIATEEGTTTEEGNAAREEGTPEEPAAMSAKKKGAATEEKTVAEEATAAEEGALEEEPAPTHAKKKKKTVVKEESTAAEEEATAGEESAPEEEPAAPAKQKKKTVVKEESTTAEEEATAAEEGAPEEEPAAPAKQKKKTVVKEESTTAEEEAAAGEEGAPEEEPVPAHAKKKKGVKTSAAKCVVDEGAAAEEEATAAEEGAPEEEPAAPIKKKKKTVVKKEGTTAGEEAAVGEEGGPEEEPVTAHTKKKKKTVVKEESTTVEEGAATGEEAGPEEEPAPAPAKKKKKTVVKEESTTAEEEATAGEEGGPDAEPAAPAKKKKKDIAAEEGAAAGEEGGPDEPAADKKKEDGAASEGGADEEPKDKKKNGAAGEETAADTKINEYVDFGGALEIEAFYRDPDKESRKRRSDIVLETAELDFEITLVDWAVGYLSLEWDPDAEYMLVKEGYVTLGGIERCPYFLRAGRLFVPFGIGTGAIVGDTLSVTDPLTIEIFETREDVVMVGKIWNGFHVAAYVFNGDVHRRRHHDHIDQFGATIRYGIERPDLSMSIGIDFISSVFDSDNLSDEFPRALKTSYSPGIAAHVRYFRNGISLIAEYNGALSTTSFRVRRGRHLHLAPVAWMVEAGYVTEICRKKTYFALNYSQSYNVHNRFPRRRFLATVGRWIYEDSVLLAFEYGNDVYYHRPRREAGRSANRFVAQLAYEW